MFQTFKTLFAGVSVQEEKRVRDIYALDLIDQKIAETEAGLNAAKGSLAALIQRHRAEEKQTKALEKRIADLMERAKAALDKKLTDLATETAGAVADMENELVRRRETVARLDQKITTLRLRVEKAQRRLVDLRQGAISAKAIRAEQNATRRVASALPNAPAKEAQDLIDSILGTEHEEPLADIYEELDDDLNNRTLEDRLGASGCGDPTKTTAADVLAKLKS
ncbi:PspA/IM30 family protein [Amylibacter sp. IMCC11727]|uniref:PspA/IM30 family protein n=1 Tax=Amylibacter sp. IMCC11727 TaxID=3039851 RepID=UPI00244DF134|nr:PspA/IM30 family protein [Amylibacter sp. IMCC11727]WGI23157.1 PspA/IM30 family protein [Amylibacter sp. IMCC11727]